MRKLKLLPVMLIAVLVLAACQAGDAGDLTLEPEATAEQTVENTDENQTEDSKAVEGTEAEPDNEPASADASDKASSNASEETEVSNQASESEQVSQSEGEASEEVAKFPVRDEKIPPYEIALRDGTTIKLDQFEGQVVMLTFFTTW